MIKIKNKGYREEILNEMWKNVENGKFAEIHNIKNSGVDLNWVNTKQVFMKCDHCGKITNRKFQSKIKEKDKK